MFDLVEQIRDALTLEPAIDRRRSRVVGLVSLVDQQLHQF